MTTSNGVYRAAAAVVVLLAANPAAHALDNITVGKSVATSEIFATLEVGEERLVAETNRTLTDKK